MPKTDKFSKDERTRCGPRYEIAPHSLQQQVVDKRTGERRLVDSQPGWVIACSQNGSQTFAGTTMTFGSRSSVVSPFPSQEMARDVLAKHLSIVEANAKRQTHILSSKEVEIPLCNVDDVAYAARITSRLTVPATKILLSIHRARRQVTGIELPLSTTINWLLEHIGSSPSHP